MPVSAEPVSRASGWRSLLRWREAFAPLLQHLLFVVYSLVCAPLVIAGLERGAVEDKSLVGWLLLAALVLEVPALYILLLAIGRRLKIEGQAAAPSLLLFGAWLAHTLVVIIMYMQALRALGLQAAIETGGWPMWLMPVLVLKQLHVLYMLHNREGREFGTVSYYGAQVVVFGFSCLVHTGFWGLMMHTSQFSSYSTALLLTEIVIVGIFFAIFYAAIQLPAVKYIAGDPHGNLRRRWLLGFCLAGIASIWPFVEIELAGRFTSLEGAREAPAEVRLLALQSRRIGEFPAEISDFSELRKLYLSRNNITTVPASIGGLHQLQHISLGYNHIVRIPPEFGELRRLETLDIYVNRLSALPPTIGQLGALRELNAGWNRLTSLPPEVGKLQQLRVLKLRKNLISKLPPEIGQLANLRVLDLAQNRLRTLPETFYRLQLKELDLTGNPLAADVRARLRREFTDTVLKLDGDD